MKRRWKTTAAGLPALAGIALALAWGSAAYAGAPEDPKYRRSYAMGVGMARSFRAGEMTVDVDAFANGLRDGLSGGKLLVSEEQLRTMVAEFDAEMRQKQAAVAKALTKANMKDGDAFLAANAKKEGVVTLPSGLQYQVLEAGKGKKPKDGDTVEAHYRGTRIDGTDFDSSRQRGKPATFKVAAVIPGWKEALKMMPVGSRWRLFVPSQLGYGERGVRASKGWGYMIEPGATLVFEMDLLAIKAPDRAGARATAAPAPAVARGN